MNLPKEIIEEILKYASPDENTWFNIFQASKLFRRLAIKTFDLSIWNHSALVFVCQHQYHNFLKEILAVNKFVNPAWSQNKLLRTACEKGHVEIAKVLLADSRTDPTGKQILYCLPKACLHWCIMYSSENGHVEVVRELLKHPKVVPSAVDNYAFTSACNHKNREIMNLLIEDKRTNHEDLLKIAIKVGDIETTNKIRQVIDDFW